MSLRTSSTPSSGPNRALSLLCVVGLVAACEGVVQGSGEIVEERRRFDQAFTALSVEDGVEVKYEVGFPVRVMVEADDNVLEHVRTRVEVGALKIDLADEVVVVPSRPVRVRVRAPAVSAVSAGSGSVLVAYDLPGDHVTVTGSDGAVIDVLGMDAERATVTLSGGSRARCVGDAGRIELAVSGDSEADIRAVRASAAQVEASGGSVARVRVSDTLSGSLSGSSRLEFLGGPAVRQIALSDTSEAFEL